jgi:ubiquinone/menaquinone biosynthesis C-methylase UbiE
VYGYPVRLAALLDPWLYRYPFEGRSATRYTGERVGFGDLDDRLIDAWAPELAAARVVLDVGAGPATFSARLAARHPHLAVLAIEPARAFARRQARGHTTIRARAERLPLADGSADVAVCLSSLRHVGDRHAAFAELRRVVRPGGVAFVVELDPTASRARRGNHTRAIASPVSRLMFGPLVCRTSPTVEAMTAWARTAGWEPRAAAADPTQPVYVLRLEHAR